MLIQISTQEGGRLMREWGVTEWPDDVPPSSQFWLFNDCGVFCVHNNEEGGIDGHMAMRKDARRYSRQMCREFMEKWGHFPIRVPIAEHRKHVKNVVLKMGGFVESPVDRVLMHDGTYENYFFLRRLPHGRDR